MQATLILVPGLLCDARLWRHQVAGLRGMARLVIADHGRHDSIAAIAAALLKAAPRRFAIAGLSMGGYVALEVFRQAPARATRLALLDTNAHADPAAASTRRQAQMAQAEGGGFAAVVETLSAALIAPAHVQGEAGEIFRAMANDAGPGVFRRQQSAIMGRADLTGLLPAIKVPSLVLCGERDALTPPAIHRTMAKAMPQSRYVEIAGAGHLTPLEAPAAVTQAMESWLMQA